MSSSGICLGPSYSPTLAHATLLDDLPYQQRQEKLEKHDMIAEGTLQVCNGAVWSGVAWPVYIHLPPPP
jgi:hypothetical protein